MDHWQKSFEQKLDRAYARGGPAQVEALLLHTEKHLQQAGANPCQLALVCNELGRLYREGGCYQKSLTAFERAGALEEGQLEASERATLLNNMAGTYRLMGNHRRAEELFLKAAALYEMEGLTESLEYASVLCNLSLVYQSIGQLEEATRCLKWAVELMEKLPQCGQELAVAYNNLTVLYYGLGNEREAMQCISRAIREYEKLPAEEQMWWGTVLNSLAGLLYGEGEYVRALELYRRSARCIRRFFGENEEYGYTCQNMRWVYEKLGDREGVVWALRQAEKAYRKVYGPKHIRTRTVVDDLARAEQK